MAKLVGICRSGDYPFERRQTPLVVDDSLTMVVQFTDSCIGCEQAGVKIKELERFGQKFQAFNTEEISAALTVTSKEIQNFLAQVVPCVGCRRSVERLYNQLVDCGHPALEPLVVSQNSLLSINREYLYDPKAIYALFYLHGSRLNVILDSVPKSKKNKRCLLHSLDTHKVRSLGIWMDVWDVMSKECREEVVLVECDCLMETIESYLRKHRFCSECKAKVLRAYSLLVGEVERSSEKNYCPALYEGLRCCSGEKHIHVSCETDFMAHLISRAEPELSGTRRERHAKTLDIAQEEVLTCLGIYLYERLHKIWQKLRAEEQTWQMLFYASVDVLKKSFEVALEKKRGISNLELLCQELIEAEQVKEQRKEQKRQKKKGKKKKGTTKNESECDNGQIKDCSDSCSNCKENKPEKVMICVTSDDNSNNLLRCEISSDEHISRCRFQMDNDICGQRCGSETSLKISRNCRIDCGYSSGHDNCDSTPGSQDSSEVACSEGICNHDTSSDSPICNRIMFEECQECLEAKINASPTHNCDGKCEMPDEDCCSKKLTSLQDMLAASSCPADGEEDFISEEEIRRFKANQATVNSKRQELRETLRERFASMQKRGYVVCQQKDEDEKGPIDMSKLAIV